MQERGAPRPKTEWTRDARNLLKEWADMFMKDGFESEYQDLVELETKFVETNVLPLCHPHFSSHSISAQRHPFGT